jgi:predicted Rossmann fold flavoprotein
MMSTSTEIVIVGAGAGGLWAAESAARSGCDVLLLEKTERTGTKILASGGGRCNLTTTLDAERAGRLFGRVGERFLRPALRSLPPRKVRERFGELGVETEEAPLEKVFPESGNAREVRDALEAAALGAGVRIQLSSSVVGVEALAAGGFRITLEGGEEVLAGRLILSAGGMSFPGTGTTGDGYRWLEELGLDVVPPHPALVPLTSPAEWVHALSGISIPDGEVRLVDGSGKVLGRRSRPLLFTHRGLSGPAAMDLSGEVERRLRGGTEALELQVDLLPELSREELRGRLIDAASRGSGVRFSRILEGAVPRRLFEAACAAVDLPSLPPLAQLSRAARHRLIEGLKAMSIPIDGTLGFDAAEVTGGGLSLRELDPRTMQVNRYPGLHVIGELLDIDGPIGGLNFQAAFATAQLAALSAARRNS